MEYHDLMRSKSQLSTRQGAELLQSACETLQLDPVSLITEVSVTFPLGEAAERVQKVETQGKLLAEEYELQAQVERGEHNVTIRLSRRQGTGKA